MKLFKNKDDTQKQPTNEEQMLLRQSAPQPTAEDEAMKLMQVKAPDGSINGIKAPAQVIGREQVQKAYQTLLKYKEGKSNLEKRIVENEQWYKLRHWECMRKKDSEVQPTSAWLFNSIANKHADAMDIHDLPPKGMLSNQLLMNFFIR